MEVWSTSFLVPPTFFGPPHMCAVCVDFKDRALRKESSTFSCILLMHRLRVHTPKLTEAFLKVEYLKEVVVRSKGESSEIVFTMTELET